jgi:hypothetical protein
MKPKPMTLPEIIAQLRREPEWVHHSGSWYVITGDGLIATASSYAAELARDRHNATRVRLMAALDALELAWSLADCITNRPGIYEKDYTRNKITARLAKALEDK